MTTRPLALKRRCHMSMAPRPFAAARYRSFPPPGPIRTAFSLLPFLLCCLCSLRVGGFVPRPSFAQHPSSPPTTCRPSSKHTSNVDSPLSPASAPAAATSVEPTTTTSPGVGGGEGTARGRTAELVAEELLAAVDLRRLQDFRETPFVVEERKVGPPQAERVEVIAALPTGPMARTTGEVLSKSTAKQIREVAGQYWDREDLQLHAGRAEASHRGLRRVRLIDLLSSSEEEGADVDDDAAAAVAAATAELKEELNRALKSKIYPFVRASTTATEPAGGSGIGAGSGGGTLFVLDAVVERLDGTDANGSAKKDLDIGLGLITVSVALNSSPDQGDRFGGGGTLIESLLPPASRGPSSPTGLLGEKYADAVVPSLETGRALLCPSTERTATLPVTSGVRDVLVLTLSVGPQATVVPGADPADPSLALTTGGAPPDAERMDRLRDAALRLPPVERGACLIRMADECPDDAEGRFWLGSHFLQLAAEAEQAGRAEENWEAVTRGVEHLRAAAALRPRCARYQFHLGVAVLVRLRHAREQGRRDVLGDDGGRAALEEAAEALGEAARLEGACVEAGVGNHDELAASLLALGDVQVRLGRIDEAIRCIDAMHRYTSTKYPFAVEDLGGVVAPGFPPQPPVFEWIRGASRGNERNGLAEEEDGGARVAIRSVGRTPVLDNDTVAMIRDAAARYWEGLGGSATSRFSMQYEGNSEVHLDELCVANPRLREAVDRALVDRVYPLVRAAFGHEGSGVPNEELCVYDSIVIRYDGDAARRFGRAGASQPLHQDFAQFSVNIALNSNGGDAPAGEPGFEGGGTFFEDLIGGPESSDGSPPIRLPLGAGHAVAHRSNVRHAGAPTTAGVREILVLFLTTRQNHRAPRAPGVERCYRLKSMGKLAPRPQLLSCLRAAMEENPADGEAPYLLGTRLSVGDNSDASEQRWGEIDSGVAHFEAAASLSPCDVRVQYYLALALQTRLDYALRTGRGGVDGLSESEQMGKICHAMDAMIRLEKAGREVGCSEGLDVAGALFTIGENFARRGTPMALKLALDYLGQIEEHTSNPGILQEAMPIMEYCKGALST